MKTWGIVYEYCVDHPNCANTACQKTVVIKPVRRHQIASKSLYTLLGISLIALGMGGILGPLIPQLRLEAGYLAKQVSDALAPKPFADKPLPQSVPVVFNPLVAPDGSVITPVNNEFTLVIPKIAVNAPVVAGVNPMKPDEYNEVLKTGVAHANTSFYPGEDGTVYLFSHSTNYEWFVHDLNAVFYLVKNLEKGDLIVLIYQGTRYSYKLTDKKVVNPANVTYLAPVIGKKGLILQTCWPPGSVSERLLIFADLIEEQTQTI